MTSRGPFRPRTFYDSMNVHEWDLHGQQPGTVLSSQRPQYQTWLSTLLNYLRCLWPGLGATQQAWAQAGSDTARRLFLKTGVTWPPAPVGMVTAVVQPLGCPSQGMSRHLTAFHRIIVCFGFGRDL